MPQQMNLQSSIETVKEYLLNLQAQICAQLELEDGGASFIPDPWQHTHGQGGGVSRVLTKGRVFEKAGVNFSHVGGIALPPSATQKRPELAGCEFTALGVSLVIHPDNPFVPTSHANVRFIAATRQDQDPIWWFGGGFDLTPYYGFEEDCIHWHRSAKQACDPFGKDLYQKYKTWCDEYFYLKHRNEARGIGGLFFDDMNEPDFATAFAFMQSIGNHYLLAYQPIVNKRKTHPFSAEQKAFQLLRRGRYVEFNLLYDRGTLFGLQSGGRTESILMSMPPMVSWEYNHEAQPESVEGKFVKEFLSARDWLEGQAP